MSPATRTASIASPATRSARCPSTASCSASRSAPWNVRPTCQSEVCRNLTRAKVRPGPDETAATRRGLTRTCVRTLAGAQFEGEVLEGRQLLVHAQAHDVEVPDHLRDAEIRRAAEVFDDRRLEERGARRPRAEHDPAVAARVAVDPQLLFRALPGE